jgi:beta-galactosidase
LRERSVTVDVVRPTADLSGYDAVVAPTLYLADGDLADHLDAYVAGGGELLVTMRSGIKDPHNKLHDAPQPGPLRDLVGAEVADHESVPEKLASRVVYDGESYDAGVWNEWLEPVHKRTAVQGRYDGERAEGEAAVVHTGHGDGAVTYVGTWPGADLAGALVGDLLDRAGVRTTAPLDDRVRLARRDGLTWVVNFGDAPVSVDAPGDSEWVVGDGTVGPVDAAVVDATPTDLTVERE